MSVVVIKKAGFNFAGLSSRMRSAIAAELNAAAEQGVSIAQQLAPVDTGFMRDHITQTETATADSLRMEITSEAEYSALVEYGTVNSEAQPFMTPAFETIRKAHSRFPKVITVMR